MSVVAPFSIVIASRRRGNPGDEIASSLLLLAMTREDEKAVSNQRLAND
jgi:hypothetical protein